MKTESVKMKEILSECVSTINSFIQKIDEEEKKEHVEPKVEMPSFANVRIHVSSERTYLSDKYSKKLDTLDTLLNARDWVWDNMEGGYRPEFRDNTTTIVSGVTNIDNVVEVIDSRVLLIFQFKFPKTAEMFLKKYRAALEEIKEFI